MKRLRFFKLLPALLALLWGNCALAADSQTQPSAPAALIGQQGAVLGQTATAPPAAAQSASKADQQQPAQGQGQAAPPVNAEAKKQPDAQTLFQESLRQMMPLDNSQIQQYRDWSDQRDRALLPVSPFLNSRTVRVSLEPGKTPVKVFTTANIATSLLIHDSTGQPWPITSVTNGGPAFFQVLRPELPDGNLLNIMPSQGYGTTTLVVTLEKQDIPLVVRLESDSVRGPERKADALVLFQIAQHGPRAKVPLIQDIKETVSSSMLAFLDHVPPAEAVHVKVKPKTDKVQVWKLGELHYIRTSHTLLWPAWTAAVNGAGGIKCYEVPVTSRIMISQTGSMQTLVLSDVLKTGGSKVNGEVRP